MLLLRQVVLLHVVLLLAVAACTAELMGKTGHSVCVVPAATLPSIACMMTVHTVHAATTSCGGALGKGKCCGSSVGRDGTTASVAEALCICAAAVHGVAALVLWAMCCKALDRRGEGTVARHAGRARKWRERC